MEISSMNSRFGLEMRMLATAAAAPSRTLASTTTKNSRRNLNFSAKFSSGTSLTSSNHVSPLFGGNLTSDFSNHSIRPSPLTSSSFSSSRAKRNVITMVIPFVREDPRSPPPPDLASQFLHSRIVFFGLPLVPAVMELIIAELIYLDYEGETEKPIHIYINSTGTMKGGPQISYSREAFAVYDSMRYISAPIYTLAVGSAWGEAALILAAGVEGNRAAVSSASIMLKQPYGRVQGQATHVGTIQKELAEEKETLVKLYARHTGKSIEQMEKDILRPKYFTPSEAVEYGIIDKIISIKGSEETSSLKKDNQFYGLIDKIRYRESLTKGSEETSSLKKDNQF